MKGHQKKQKRGFGAGKDIQLSAGFTGGIKTGYSKIPKNAETEAYSPKRITLMLPVGYSPTVKSGDTVVIGETVGECPDAPDILCGICGTVTVSGRCVSVESNGKREFADKCSPIDTELKEMSESELRSALYKMGVPVSEPARKSPVCLTVNCCETLPSSVSARMTVIERGAAVIGGAKIIMKLIGAKKAICAVPKFMYKYANILESYLPDSKTIKVMAVSDKYPQTFPHMIVSSLYRTNINVQTDTANAGYPIVSAELCAAAYDALANGVPYTEGYVTVSGGIDGTRCMRVPFGSDIKELAGHCGAEGVATCGYPGFSETGDHTGKDLRSIVFVSEDAAAELHPCIECGRCVSVCPVSLVPSMIAKSIAENGNCPEKLNADCCISCGCCDAVCPSAIPLLKIISEYNRGQKEG